MENKRRYKDMKRLAQDRGETEEWKRKMEEWRKMED